MALLRTNTGIGTTNPTSALHVIGDVLVTGVVTAIGFNGNINAGIGTITNLSVTREVVGTSTVTDLINTRLTSGLGTITTLNSSTATINNITNNLLSSGVGTITNLTSTNSTITRIDSTHINAGIVTANQLSTGAIGSSINITSSSITGPSSIVIDPAGVGDNTGAVRIKGDLYVDGDQFYINSGTIELADLRVGIATTVGSNLLLDGGGIGIGSTNIIKTLTYNYASDSLKSSENFDIASGKTYKINGTDVLSSNTLGNGVIYSSLQYLGTLNNLNVSGLSTFPTLVGTYATITEIDNTRFLSGISTITNLYVSNGYINVGVVTDLTNTRLTSGIGTITDLINTRFVSGISTITDLYASNGYINVGVVTDLTNTRLTSGIASVTNLYASNGYINVGVVTDLTNTRFVSGISSVTNLYASNGYINVGVVTDLTNTRFTSGIATVANLDVAREVVGISTITNLYVSNGYVNVGVVTDLTNTRLTSGIATVTDLINTRFVSGISSVTNLYASNGYINVGVVTDLTNTRLTSGIATVANLDVAREVVGISTITNLYASNGYINVGVVTDLTNTRFTSGIATITTLNSTNIVSTNSDFTNLNANNAFVDVGIVTDISGTRLNYTGVGTIATLDTTTGTIDYLTNTDLTVSGIATIQNLEVQGDFDVYDATATFHNNVFISGNLSIGGTSSVIIAQDLKVLDKEITLGITTNAFNQDVSNDITANHGGIAIASTEGYPLVDLTLAGFSSLPSTYKQVMWVASNSYGVGTTDAWMFNYAIGIGSTLVPNNVRLAVGNVQITDKQINATTGEFARLSSGIATFTGADIGNLHSNNLFAQSGIITDISGTRLTYTGFGTITNLYSSNAYINVGVVTDLTNTRFTSGIATITTLSATNGNILTGIVTDISGTRLNYTGVGTIATLNSNNSNITTANITNANVVTGIVTDISGTRLNYTGVGTITTLNSTTANIANGNIVTGIVTDISGTRLNYTGVGTITTLNSTNGTITNLSGTNLSYTNANVVTGVVTDISGTRLNYTGVGTIATLNSTTSNITNANIVTGIVTDISGTRLNYTGVGTIATLDTTTGTITNISGTNVSYTNANIVTGVVTSISGTNISYSGVGTITTLNSTNSNLTTANITNANVVTGIVTDISGTRLNYTGVGTIATLNSTTGTITNLSGSNVSYTNANVVTGVVTDISGTRLNYTGVGTITTLNSTTANITNANIVTGIVTDISGTRLNYTGVGTIATLNSTTGTITNLSGTNINYTGVATITTLNVTTVTNTNIDATGIITASQFSTGANGIGINTDTISGPAVLYIDPAAVGDNTGAVRIKGDLYVDGTQTVINSQTIDLADFRIGIGTTAANDIILDGAGIGIGSASNQKTFVWNNSSSSLKSSENLDLALGKTYKINGTDVLSSTTLGSGVVNSSLTSVGTLNQLNVSGATTSNSYNIGGTQVISAAKQLQNISSLDATTTATIEAAIANPPNSFTDLQVTGISTFTNGPVFIGSGTTTGTLAQPLQVTGGAYVSGNLGVGTTNPQYKLDVLGNVNFTGSLFQNGTRFTSGIGIGSTSVNPQSGFINQRIGIGFTDLNIVGTGISVTGYGSTVVIDFGNIAAASGALSISTVFNPRIQDITFVGGATTSRIGISTQTDRFVYDAQTGSVGIGTFGTSIPSYKLDVIGDINSSTSVRVKGVDVLEESVRLAIALG
jgi:hypothetical protein